MLVYEVTIEVEPSIRSSYEAWLRPHVAEILALPGFTGAEILEVVEPRADDGWIAIRTQYRLVDRTALDAYLSEHAPRLRADGMARFGDAMRARRCVLAPLPA
jgi:antibiotic biosynthesis monooxygenase (ABM) superfamily enzyme